VRATAVTSRTSSSTAPICSTSTGSRSRDATETTEFSGIAIRGAANCCLNFWMVGSTWGPSFGVRSYHDRGRPTLDTPELRAAVEHYVDLVPRAGPPESATMDFTRVMACYGAGRAAMTIELANEASILDEEGGPAAAGTETALVPAGRSVAAIRVTTRRPTRSRRLPARRRPHGSSQRSSARPSRCSATPSEAASSRSRAVLANPCFVARFRPELLETTVATRAFARGEHPVTLRARGRGFDRSGDRARPHG